LPKKFTIKEYRRLLPLARFTTKIYPKIARWPVMERIRPVMELFTMGTRWGNKTQVFAVPLNAEISPDKKGTVLPYKLLEDAIDQSAYCTVWNQCWCREANSCKDYPIDHGCIFLGKGALPLVEGGVAREVDKETTKAHLRKAGELGLVPLACYVEVEQKAFGIPKELHENLLEICLCCPCCCIGFNSFRFISGRNRWRINSVGFTAKAGDECKGCGKCVKACPLEAIHVNGDKVWVNEDNCIGCGICQQVCSFDAVKLVQVGRDPGGILRYFKGLNLDLTRI